MIILAHKTEGVNRTKTVRFYPFVFTGEEHDEETSYGYCNDYQPHAVRRMFDYNDGMLYDMRWDEAGNLGQVSMGRPGEMFEKGRFLFWTEDNRMHTAVNGKYYSYYAYDYGGERRLKLTGDNKQLDVNADFMVTYTVLNEPTLYPSAYMVLTNKGYTKHYYAGTERVAARIGGGCLKTLEKSPKLQKAADLLFKQSHDQTYERMLKDNDLGCIKNPAEDIPPLHAWIDGIPDRMKARVDVDNSAFRRMICRMTEDCEEEPDVYFYHSDHLSSASWITDSIGIPIQHLQYLPYGEPYIDQRAAGTTYSERFRFTGKERDEETGYGYFGARYMDHELTTMWLSVDPMADKYPSISPYAYCAWNPVKLVDPDGRDIWEIDGEGRVVNCIKDNKKDAFYRVDENGKRMDGDENHVEFKYGTIESHIKRSYSYKNQTGTYDAFQIRGDDNGEELFKFFANTVADQNMEVSHIKCGVAGDKGLNFVSTAHFKPITETREDGSVHRIASEPSQSCLWNGRLRYGYTVREINHSHPMTKDPSTSDVLMANHIREIYSSIRHAPAPSLNIYYVKDGQYYPY